MSGKKADVSLRFDKVLTYCGKPVATWLLRSGRAGSTNFRNMIPRPCPALKSFYILTLPCVGKSKGFFRIDAGVGTMVEQMFELMYEARGIGLAANQVGLPYRLFVINPTGDKEEKDQEFVFINPQITKKKGSETDEEGCLSLPEIYGPVTRATKIVVDAFDLDGQQFELELEDLPARVVQHEYDHVEGVMFTDRVAANVRRSSH